MKLSTKPSSSRAAFPVKRAIQNPRSVCNRSSLRSHAKHRPHHGNAQKTCEPDRTPHRAAHRRQRHRNRGDVPTFSKRQKQRRHHRLRHQNSRRIITLRQRFCRRKIYRARIHNPRASARKIFAPVQKHAHRNAHQRQRRRSKDDVPTFSKQRKQQHSCHLHRNSCKIIMPCQRFRRRKIYHARIHNSRASARKIFVPVQKHAHHNAHQHQRRRSKDDVLTYSRQQKQRQRRRSRQNRSRNVLPQLCQHRKMHRDRHRKHLVCARMIYDCALNRKRRSIRQPQHHKSLDGVLSFKRLQKILQKRLYGSRC